MKDYIEHMLEELEKVLGTHVNEENPLKEQAERMYVMVARLQAEYATYQRDQQL